MILADTSIWIDHFRNGNKDLTAHLENDSICIHPFIIGEIACGSLKERWEVLQYLKTLRHVDIASHEEALVFIDMYKLFSMGIGYVDVNLLASAKLSGVPIWTLDKRLKSVAKTLLVDF